MIKQISLNNTHFVKQISNVINIMSTIDGFALQNHKKNYSRNSKGTIYTSVITNVRIGKIVIQGTHQMAAEKEAINLSSVYSYFSKCNLTLF